MTRKKRIDTHVTLDTQVIVNNRRESIFRHLEDNTLHLRMIANYNSRKGYTQYCVIIPNTCLHWRMTQESFMTYYARMQRNNIPLVCLDYDSWCIGE